MDFNAKIEEAVFRGAQLLDQEDPTWYNKVKLNRLSMDSCENCVVGQTVGEGSYDTGVRKLFGNMSSGKREELAADHGFSAGDRYDDDGSWRPLEVYRALDAEWTRVINFRRDPGNEPAAAPQDSLFTEDETVVVRYALIGRLAQLRTAYTTTEDAEIKDMLSVKVSALDSALAKLTV